MFFFKFHLAASPILLLCLVLCVFVCVLFFLLYGLNQSICLCVFAEFVDNDDTIVECFESLYYVLVKPLQCGQSMV